MMSEELRTLPVKDAYKFGLENGLGDAMEKIRQMEIEWDSSYTTTVRRGYIVDAFEKQGIFEEFKKAYWPTGNTLWGKSKTKFFLKVRQRYEDFLQSGEQQEVVTGEADEKEEQEFAAERDLREFLVKNPHCIEKGLQIYEADGKFGNEFSIDEGKGRIDLLAVDGQGRFVVVELKLTRGRNKTLGQLLYYMGWVDKNLSKSSSCRGIIIAREIPEDLVLAARRVPDVSLCEYKLSVSVTPIPLH
jgi:endonuclease